MNPEKPIISVLMPVRDERPDFLDVALSSIVSQSYIDFEVVLLDDGSLDENALVALTEWAVRDKRIRLFREPARGLTRSLNIGLQYCRGEFVARHDSDDWSDNERFKRQIEFLRANPDVGVVGSQIMLHMENGKKLWQSKLPERHNEIVASFPKKNNPFCHGALMFRRQLALKVGGYREILSCSQDYDFFWRMSECMKTANLCEVLYHHRRSGSSISAKRAVDQKYATHLAGVLARMRGEGPENIAIAEAEAKQFINSLNLYELAERKYADQLMLGGDFRRSAVAFMKVIVNQPLDIRSYAAFSRCVLFFLFPPLRRYLFRS